jgi:hypothetical protein
MTLGIITPILRSFDEAKAREFYIDYLGFSVDWEHRFEQSRSQPVADIEEVWQSSQPI